MKRSITILFACLSLPFAASGCSDATDDDASATNARRESLIGGVVIGPETLPEVVYWQNSQVACTGTFVTKRHLLTAAHCVGGVQPGTVIYTSNASDVRTVPLTPRVVALARVHPAYATDWTMDVGVIELAADADVAVHPLQRWSVRPAVSSVVTVVGYGCQTVMYGHDGYVRKAADAPLYSLDYDSLVSRAAYGFGMCSGDSGGPMFYAGNIVGIASASWFNDGGQVVQSIHADLSRAVDWLIEIGVMPQPPTPVGPNTGVDS